MLLGVEGSRPKEGGRIDFLEKMARFPNATGLKLCRFLKIKLDYIRKTMIKSYNRKVFNHIEAKQSITEKIFQILYVGIL